MTLIAAIETAGLIFACSAAMLIFCSREILDKDARLFMFITASAIALSHFASANDWLHGYAITGWGNVFNNLIPIFWALGGYSWLQVEKSRELERLKLRATDTYTAMTESQRQLRTLINNVNGMVYRCKNDPQWTAEFVSDQCKNLTGYEPDELVDNRKVSYAEIIHPDDRDYVWETVQEAIRLKRPFELLYRIRTASGKIKQVWEQGIGIYGNNADLLALEGFVQDRTLLYQLSEKVQQQDTYDRVTGLYNTKAFNEHLAQSMRTNVGKDVAHALLLLDLDRFTVLNDSCGLTAGDDLLHLTAKTIRKSVRMDDHVARLGGDKFAILLENCPFDKALKIAEKIRKDIESLEYEWGGKRFYPTVSGGLAVIDDMTADGGELLNRANDYCRVAKELGRNRIAHHEEEEVSTKLSQRRDELVGVSMINHAFRFDRFHLCYQPILPIASDDHSLRFEILLRMEDEIGEVVPPSFFIPVAENYGLADRMDRWVLDRVLTWLEKNSALLTSLKHCSINLSGQSLGKTETMGFIADRLNASYVPAEKICFEITETAAIADFNAATKFIRTLREIGCTFALDDFGSGLSSFAYLKGLDVDYLKIDGQFVRDMAADRVDYETVMAINRIGKTTGKKTIAEFVENEKSVDLLREIGVDYGQGYFFARPRRLEELLKEL